MESLADILIQNRRLETDEAFVAYEDALNRLRTVPKHEQDLPKLISAFCDVEDHEGMWSLLHLVESFPMEDYLPALVAVTPQLMADARAWLDTLYVRIVNGEPCRLYLRTMLPSLSPLQQTCIRQILEHLPDDVQNADLRQQVRARAAFVLSGE